MDQSQIWQILAVLMPEPAPDLCLKPFQDSNRASAQHPARCFVRRNTSPERLFTVKPVLYKSSILIFRIQSFPAEIAKDEVRFQPLGLCIIDVPHDLR